jgi:hypothetical protein
MVKYKNRMNMKFRFIFVLTLVSSFFLTSFAHEACDSTIQYRNFKIRKIQRLNLNSYSIYIEDAESNEILIDPIISTKYPFDGKIKDQIIVGSIYRLKIKMYYVFDIDVVFKFKYKPVINGKRNISITSVYGVYLTENLNGLFFVDSATVEQSIKPVKNELLSFTYDFINSISAEKKELFSEKIEYRSVKKSMKIPIKVFKKMLYPNLSTRNICIKSFLLEVYFQNQQDFLIPENFCVSVLKYAKISTVKIDWVTKYPLGKKKPMLLQQSMVLSIKKNKNGFKIISIDLTTPPPPPPPPSQ